MDIFVFYPHVYTECDKDKIIAYDCKRHVGYVDKYNPSESHPRWIYKKSNEQLIIDFLQAELGYEISCQTIPYFPSISTQVVSSLRKVSNQLMYKEGFHTKELMSTLHIWGHNTSHESVTDLVCHQLDFPTFNDTNSLTSKTIAELQTSWIDTIILSGELDDYMLNTLLPVFYQEDRETILRSFATTSDIERYKKLLSIYDGLQLELLLENDETISQWKSLLQTFPYHVRLIGIVTCVSDVDLYKRDEISQLLIRLNDSEEQKELVNEMLVSEDDIYSQHLEMEEISRREIINPLAFGNITITSSSQVFGYGQRIGTLHERQLYPLINEWLHNPECSWFQTRQRKESCKDCLYKNLCPSISIYEMLGVISKACNKRNEVKV